MFSIVQESTEESEKKCKELLTAVEEIERLLKEANESMFHGWFGTVTVSTC